MSNEIQLKEGNFAPDFTLDTDGNGQVTLSELRGKNVVLYFYPKDDTPGCTLEAKDFADNMTGFNANNTVIFGVSKDPVKSHDKFKEKYCLPFTLASDANSTVCEAYGVWVEKSMYGKTYMGIERTTFLINSKGKIVKIWRKVKVDGHVDEVLSEVRSL
jgi:peroxiredoxin Q/BCP